MKKTGFRLLAVLFLAAALATIAAAPGINNPLVTQFSGTETFGPVLNPGTMVLHDDGQLMIRGLVQQAHDENTDGRVTGDITLEINTNFDAATFSGQMWGTAHLKNAGGEWIITWVGRRTPEGHSDIQAVGRGVGGYEGLQARWNYTRSNPDPNAPMAITGFILDPGR